MAVNSRQYNQFPYDPNMGDQSKQALDWMVIAINQLLGSGQAQSGQGINSLVVNTVDPTTGQITSQGNRTGSVTTAINFDAGTAGSTQVIFYWDGINGGSVALRIYRDDGSISGPFIQGSPFTVTGLVTATTYYFYPYFDENLQQVEFATVPNVAVGTPPVAFLAQNPLALQQQILRGRIQLGILLATTGVATGGGTGSGGNGGGGSGGSGGGRLK